MEQEQIGNNYRNRFSDAKWCPKVLIPVLIGGAGGIGSWVSFLLARIGFDIYIYDFDKIEGHNLGGQFYSQEQINSFKTEALKENIKNFSGQSITTIVERYDENAMGNKFIFSCFDNMASRKIMFEKWVELYGDKEDALFIDGRLGLENMDIFCVTSKDIEKYRETLFEDAEIKDAPCNLKQSTHTAFMISSFMTSFFLNHITNLELKKNACKVPFKFQVFTPMNFINAEDNE